MKGCVSQSEEHLTHYWIHMTKNKPLNAPNGVNRPWRKSVKKIRKPFRGSKRRGEIPNPWILLCHFPKILHSNTSSHFLWHLIIKIFKHLIIKIFKQTTTLNVFYNEHLYSHHPEAITNVLLFLFITYLDICLSHCPSFNLFDFFSTNFYSVI